MLAMCLAFAKEPFKVKSGSCGTVVRNAALKIVDPDTGASLGRNQPGEICIRGEQIMKGTTNSALRTFLASRYETTSPHLAGVRSGWHVRLLVCAFGALAAASGDVDKLATLARAHRLQLLVPILVGPCRPADRSIGPNDHHQNLLFFQLGWGLG